MYVWTCYEINIKYITFRFNIARDNSASSFNIVQFSVQCFSRLYLSSCPSCVRARVAPFAPEVVVSAGFIEPADVDDSESPRFLTKRTECISISGDILGRTRREDSLRRLPLVRRASVPNYRVGFMNTIAATARKLAWRHCQLLPLMNLCICILRRCSARGTPRWRRVVVSPDRQRFLTLLCRALASRLATPEGCRAVSISSTLVYDIANRWMADEFTGTDSISYCEKRIYTRAFRKNS